MIKRRSRRVKVKDTITVSVTTSLLCSAILMLLLTRILPLTAGHSIIPLIIPGIVIGLLNERLDGVILSLIVTIPLTILVTSIVAIMPVSQLPISMARAYSDIIGAWIVRSFLLILMILPPSGIVGYLLRYIVTSRRY